MVPEVEEVPCGIAGNPAGRVVNYCVAHLLVATRAEPVGADGEPYDEDKRRPEDLPLLQRGAAGFGERTDADIIHRHTVHRQHLEDKVVYEQRARAAAEQDDKHGDAESHHHLGKAQNHLSVCDSALEGHRGNGPTHGHQRRQEQYETPLHCLRSFSMNLTNSSTASLWSMSRLTISLPL